MKRDIVRDAKSKFLIKGSYRLDNKFAEILLFAESVGSFLSRFSGDSFLTDEVRFVKSLVEEIFTGTPYELRFRDVFDCQ